MDISGLPLAQRSALEGVQGLRRRVAQIDRAASAAALGHVALQLHGRLRSEQRRLEELEGQRLSLLTRLREAAEVPGRKRRPVEPPSEYELFVLERPAV